MNVESISKRKRVSFPKYVAYLEAIIVPQTGRQSEVYKVLKGGLTAQGKRKTLARIAAHNHAVHGQLTPRIFCSDNCRVQGIRVSAETKKINVVV